MEISVINIDGIEYTIIDKIDKYIYLLDLNNPNNFKIMTETKEELVSVTDEMKINIALDLFNKKLQ
jgi:hypothetical protein